MLIFYNVFITYITRTKTSIRYAKENDKGKRERRKEREKERERKKGRRKGRDKRERKRGERDSEVKGAQSKPNP